jgi:hypothetical protein
MHSTDSIAIENDLRGTLRNFEPQSCAARAIGKKCETKNSLR